MRWLPWGLAGGLAIAVGILSCLLLRRERVAVVEPPPAATVPAGPRLERVSDTEDILKKLGYAAWVYRWHGGMLDGELRRDAEAKPQVVGGKPLWTDVRNFGMAINKTPPALTDVRGTLVVMAGPIKMGQRPATIPCRVFIHAEIPGTVGSRDFTEQVAFAQVAAESEMAIEVLGRFIENGSGFSANPASKYKLLELKWLSDAEK